MDKYIQVFVRCIIAVLFCSGMGYILELLCKIPQVLSFILGSLIMLMHFPFISSPYFDE